MKKSKGITLISLLITIIFMIILTGVTIKTISGDDGIITTAVKATEKHKQAQIEEKLELLKANLYKIKVQNGSKIEAADYFEELKKEGIIEDSTIGGNNIKELEIDSEGNKKYEIITEDGEVIEVIITPEGEIKIEYQGTTDRLPPRVKAINIVNKSANSMTIQVTVNRLEDGKLSYYYKKEEEQYHELEKNTTNFTVQLTNLEQNKVYNIKVVAENKKGRSQLIKNEMTGELANGTISLKGETVWDNGLASIEIETTQIGVVLQYQVNNINGEWQTYNGRINNLKYGDHVYARIYDGVNGSEESTIIISEKIAPIINITKGLITTNSITVSVSSMDKESGMITSPIYNYYIKQESENEYSNAIYTGVYTSYTFNGLLQNTNYSIKVTTKDKAENEGESILANITTGKVGGANTDLASGNIIASSPTWSNGKASITLSTTTGMQIQWQKGGISGNWTTGTNVTGLNHNNIVYARLWDGTNAGSEASITIKDKTAPSAATITLGATSANTGENITAKVTHKDAQSGPKIASCKWVYNKTSTAIGTTASSYTGGTFTSNEQTINLNTASSGTYYLHVLTVDNAGNAKETISTAITIKQLATGISLNSSNIEIDKGATSQLTATVTPSNTSNKGVKWTTNKSSVATVSNTGLVTGVTPGEAVITATTTDGSNKSVSCTVKVIGWIFTTTNSSYWSWNGVQPASTSNPSIITLKEPNEGTTTAKLEYNGTINKGDTVEISRMYTSTYNGFTGSQNYLDARTMGRK